MGWRIIKQPNGLYARFSEVVDNITDYDMTKSEALVLCRCEHGMTQFQADMKVKSADENNERFTECLETIESVHGESEKSKVLEMCCQI